MRKILFAILIINILVMTSGSFVVAVEETPKYDLTADLFDDETSFGINTGGLEPTYRKWPMERYAWDSNYSLIEFDGLVPTMGDIGALSTNNFASMMLTGAQYIVRFSVSLIQAAFHTDFMREIISSILPKLRLINSNISSSFGGLAALAFSVWVLYTAFIKNETTKTMKGIVSVIVVSGFLVWIMANMSFLVTKAAEISDSAALTTMGAVSAGATGTSWAASADNQIVSTANALWDVIVDEPWAYGQFGDKSEKVTVSAGEYTAAAREGISVTKGQPWKEALLSWPPGSKERKSLVEVLADPEIDHGTHPKVTEMMGPGASGTRIYVGGSALIAAILSFIYISLTAVGILFTQIALIVLIPILGMIGIMSLIPDFGFNVLRKWLTITLGFFIKKILIAAFLGVMFLAAESVLDSEARIVTKLFLVMVVFLFGSLFLYRKILVPVLSQARQAYNDAKGTYNGVRNTFRELSSKGSSYGSDSRYEYEDTIPEYNADLEGFNKFQDVEEPQPWSSTLRENKSSVRSNFSGYKAPEVAVAGYSGYDCDTGANFEGLAETAPPPRSSKRWISPAEMAENQRLARKTKFIMEDMIATDDELARSYDIDRDAEFIRYDDEEKPSARV